MNKHFAFSVSAILTLVVILILVLFAILFTNSFEFNSPPSITDIQQQFDDNYTDIKVIAEFLTNANYEHARISEANGTMWGDFSDIEIQSNEVVDAINRILKNGNYISITKLDNTIYFLQWRRGSDIGAGIAYSINGIDLPNISYMTQCHLLSKDNWYYYVSDYNSWRNQQS